MNLKLKDLYTKFDPIFEPVDARKDMYKQIFEMLLKLLKVDLIIIK